MKVKLNDGKIGCDLACYPYCAGFFREGCLLFGDKVCFFLMKTQMLGEGKYFYETGLAPSGVWAEYKTVEFGKKMKLVDYINELVH